MYPLFEGVNMDIVDRTGDKRNTLEKPVTPRHTPAQRGGTKVRSWKGRKLATLRSGLPPSETRVRGRGEHTGML